MRPHTGPQQQQQQAHHPQQYCALDNNLKQQQHFAKAQQKLQQQSGLHISQQQNYHQHQLQQHVLHHQQPPPSQPHMWNPHLASTCFSSPPATGNPNSVNTSINLQSCRLFPNNRMYQQPTHAPHYPPTNGFPHAIPASSQASERMALTAPNYAKLPPLSVVNQQRINECAGIPLISTATAHLTPGQRQRISRKQSHSPPAKNWSNMMSNNAAAAQSYATAAHYAAAHVQGAPLMLSKQQQAQMTEYWSPTTYVSTNHQQHQQQFSSNLLQYNSKQHNRARTTLRYQNSAPASLVSSKSKENLVHAQLKHSKDNDNTSSNNGDSSNSNETCLPRIIKPRKRRKKDRKPPNSLVNAVYLKMDNKTLHDKSTHTQVYSLKSNKSAENLVECLEKFTKITNLNEQTQRSNSTTSAHIFEISSTKEPDRKISHGPADSTNNHGICFCIECDPLRSLWDYPLKRSLSDSSTSVTSGTGSLSDNNATTTSDYSWSKGRAEIVGVIGSKRNRDLQNSAHKPNNIFHKRETTQENVFFNNNILSGINFASELFKQTNCTQFNNLDEALSAPENMLLLPETAETLLTKSINEISKKLIETCSNETNDLTLSSCNSLSSFSTASSNSSSANSSCADFSNDSGIESAHINAGDDLVFNFDNLHITTTKLSLSLSPSSLSSSASLASSSSSSSSTSSCGNLSMSSSPTVKFTSNFLTTPATAASTIQQTAKTTPLTPSHNVMGTTMKAAPTLDFLLDLNNNHLHVAAPNTMINAENQQQQQQLKKQQFNDLVQNHQPPQQQQQQKQQQQQQQQQEEKLQSALPPTHQHDQQQFFNNCFDLMWQHNERQLGNSNTNAASTSTTTNTNTTTTDTTTINSTTNNNNISICNNTNSNRIEQLTSSALTSNNVAMSSFLDSLGSLKAVFSTLS